MATPAREISQHTITIAAHSDTLPPRFLEPARSLPIALGRGGALLLRGRSTAEAVCAFAVLDDLVTGDRAEREQHCDGG